VPVVFGTFSAMIQNSPFLGLFLSVKPFINKGLTFRYYKLATNLTTICSKFSSHDHHYNIVMPASHG